MRQTALPFAVHPAWRAEFARRWNTAQPLLLTAFVAMPLVVTGALVVALLATNPLVIGFAVALVVPVTGYLFFFAAGRRYLVRPRYWAVRAGALGSVQLVGVMLPSAVAGGVVAVLCPLLAAAAIVAGTVLAHRANRVLFAAEGGAPAAAALPIQRELRVHPPQLFGSVTIGMDRLSWHLKPRGLYGFPAALMRDSVPFAEITGVGVVRIDERGAPLVAAGVPAPPGPAVVVRTHHREAFVAVDDAEGLAALLDLRLRLAAEPGWAH